MGTEGAPVLEQLGRQLPLIDPNSLAGAASLRLAGRLESVRSAREFTRDILRTWRLSEQFDAVGLVVSELVTNALRHAVDGRPLLPGASPVELELLRSARRLVCAVHDPGDAVPRINDADIADEGGRGLRLVECFSDGWGWRPRTGGLSGKVVWASFRLD
jgi:anti-sigma regulatory factor (Ser/Thr protein kinase)